MEKNLLYKAKVHIKKLRINLEFTKNYILQCQLPALPPNSLVTVTYTPNYVNNMRSAVVKRR